MTEEEKSAANRILERIGEPDTSGHFPDPAQQYQSLMMGIKYRVEAEKAELFLKKEQSQEST